MKKTVSILVTMILALAMLVSCGPAEEPAPAPAESPGEADLSGLRAGLAIHFQMDDYGVIATQAFVDVMEEAGVGTITVLDANGDPQKQLADMESFLAQEYDIIVISPMDDQAVVDVLNRATAQGIITVTITYVPGGNVTSNVEAGNYEFSYEVATELASLMDYEGTIAIMDIPMNLWRTGRRHQAFLDVIDQHPGLEVVTVDRRLSPEEARMAAEGILTANPDLGAIWGTFSNVVYGAGAAVRDMGRSEVIVGGIDADASILHLMRDGWIHAVAAQLPYSHGEMAARAGLNAFLGLPFNEEYLAEYRIYVQGQEERASEEVWGRPLD